MTITAFAPGRVNLIGEHTDYTGGLVLPMALDLGVTITAERSEGRFHLTSDNQGAQFELLVPWGDPSVVEPSWGRFPAAAAAELGTTMGLTGTIASSLPAGGTGLSTSSALTCAALLAIGGDGDRMELAQAARRAEIAATGILCGIMDQATSLNGVKGHAIRIDCHTLDLMPVALPDGLEVLVVHSGQERALADSLYNERRNACFAAEEIIGPLRLASLGDVERIPDETVRKRARHVVGDNHRVTAMIHAFESGDIALASNILTDGHRSYADYFEASTPEVEAMVRRLEATPGIHAARLTGGGFGGSIVAFAEPGVEPSVETWWTRARPGAGATLVNDEISS